MITIDTSLPVPIRPLSWLLGRWQGYGVVFGDKNDQMVLEDLEITAADNQLLLSLRVWEAAGSVPPPTPAAEGVSQLVRGDLLRTEELYLSLSEAAVKQFNTQISDTANSEVSSRHLLEGQTQTRDWSGVAEGPRIQIQSAGGRAPSSSVSAQSDRPDRGLVRMFGLVGGELMWTQSEFSAAKLQATGRVTDEDLSTDITGRLSKIDLHPLFNTSA
ncbi:heme-binding beta-barrel domain-containing protein [Boudabousia marimammalium]|uniref:THAP4-like heme-binding domain-containing protein n=1 Tax=Boudabousia marimammalium TaxID=156892 RepID=A0A1Q5PM94_9ACTO|nr:heme-binding beta-barrel domain-containing protein [Boudabousia marimammalium]OKL48678.1 hypothetical protein BM477_05630 [Boudabousia marimammalium]